MSGLKKIIPSWMKKAVIMGTLALLILCPVYDALGDRTTLYLYRYANISSPDGIAAFESFQQIITTKFLTLVDELQGIASLPSLNILAVHKVLDAKTGQYLDFAGLSSLDLETYWEAQGALAVLLGRLQERNQVYLVRTRFFLGKLKGTLPSPSVNIELPVRDDQFDTTRDSHSAMTLYALAMAATAQCQHREQVMQLFDEALIRATSAKDAFENFDEIKKAIAAGVDQLKMKCP